MIITIILIILLILHIPLFLNFPKVPVMDDAPYDVCIVLGCPAREDGKPSRMQRSRMNKAIQLYQERRVHTILISGAGVRNNFIEADVMAEYGFNNGIPINDILLEKEAQNTFDNLRLAKEICEQNRFHRSIVVTSRFHIRRSNFFVKKFFTNYAMCPTDDKEKIKHYLAEYVRMWNTLRIEMKLKYKK